MFAGLERPADVQSFAEAAGYEYIGFEKDKGQDVRVPSVRADVIDVCSQGGHLAAGPLCRSFSRLREMTCEPTRSRDEPWGLARMPAKWRAYIDAENSHITLTAEAAMLVFEGGYEFIIEQPADDGDPDHPLFKPHRAHAAHMFLTRPFRDLMMATGARVVHTVQCGLGGLARKPSDILASPRAFKRIAWMEGLIVNKPHGCFHLKHPRPAVGRGADGVSNASRAAAWPGLMCGGVFAGLTGEAGGPRTAMVGGESGGLISDGPQLHPAVRVLLEQRRATPPRYLDLRHLRPATYNDLAARPYILMPVLRSPEGGGWLEQPGTDDDSSQTSSNEGRDGPPPTIRLRDIPKRRHWQRLVDWLQVAQGVLQAWRRGEMAAVPQPLTITQRQVHRWARGRRYDARDPEACTELQPSTRHTKYPGGKQLDRARFRETCAALDWHLIDPDIVSQVGEGGVVSNSTRALTTTLRLHHPGVRHHFAVADGMMQAEVDDSAAGVCTGMIPFWPTNAMPRDLVWKDKYDVDADGGLTVTPSPRLTFDPTSGDDSLNAGIPKQERSLQLPALRSFAEGAAVCDSAATREGSRADLYAADVKSAFPHLLLQRLEWPMHCYVWIDASGTVQVRWFYRVTFGAAYAPQRFGRAMAPIDAAGLLAIAAHEVRFPYSQPVLDWVNDRASMQSAGRLPAGPDQLQPRHCQRFVDDLQGSGLGSQGTLPKELADIPIGGALTAAFGGTPSHPSSHAAIHLRLLIRNWERHDITPAHNKTMCGSRLPTLGARVGVPEWRIDIPSVRVAVITSQIQLIQRSLTHRPPGDGPIAKVDPFELERLTGRLGYVTQTEPELIGTLQAGYAIPATARRLMAQHKLRRKSDTGAVTTPIHTGKRLGRSLAAMLETGARAVTANVGVPLAAAASFPPIEQLDVLTVVTDASFAASNPTGIGADDGVGGFAFTPAQPRTAFVFSTAWSPRTRAALVNEARKRSEKLADPREDNFSMPAAETFGTLVLPELVRARGVAFRHVAAVGDCDPVEAGVAKGGSTRPQINRMHQRMRRTTSSWLATSVPRDLNLDADNLSHPSRLGDVQAAAVAAGYHVVVLLVTDEMWRWVEDGLGETGSGEAV